MPYICVEGDCWLCQHYAVNGDTQSCTLSHSQDDDYGTMAFSGDDYGKTILHDFSIATDEVIFGRAKIIFNNNKDPNNYKEFMCRHLELSTETVEFASTFSEARRLEQFRNIVVEKLTNAKRGERH